MSQEIKMYFINRIADQFETLKKLLYFLRVIADKSAMELWIFNFYKTFRMKLFFLVVSLCFWEGLFGGFGLSQAYGSSIKTPTPQKNQTEARTLAPGIPSSTGADFLCL